jgi:uncharacterized membrane-anchored protein
MKHFSLSHLSRASFGNLLFALSFPIIILLSLLVYKQTIINTGQTVTLPIIGFDPRDLLSGHYLRYRIDYKASNSCDYDSSKTVELCLKPKAYFLDPSQVAIQACDLHLVGYCQKGQFIAGIERFYIPEQYAQQLDKKVRDAQGSLQVSVTKNGMAVIETLLIDGQPWLESLE